MRARAVFSKTIRKSAARTDFRAASIRRCGAMRAAGFPKGWYGLDQGLLVMMIENYRSGLIWEIVRHCGYVRDGLKRAGFEGGWL